MQDFYEILKKFNGNEKASRVLDVLLVSEAAALIFLLGCLYSTGRI